jgi:threonine/homoserine/homoserine lactone efflux protein
MPIDPTTLLAFLVTVLAVVLSVGPDTLLIIRYTMSSGPRTGIATVMGVQLGLFTHTALAAVGISLVIASSTIVFKAIAIAGAAYLAWLGVQGFRAAGLVNVEAMMRGSRVSPWKGMRDAMLTNLLNPKVIVLFLALMPNFVAPERGRIWLQLVILGVALFAINVVWQMGIMLVADRARVWLGRPGVQRAVSWSTSAVLFIFAAGLLIDHVF